MRFVASFIFLLTVICIRASSDEPETRHEAYTGVQTNDQRYYATPATRNTINTERLVRIIVLAQLINRLRSQGTTTTTTMASDTTTPLPDEFKDWKEYKECRYQAPGVPTGFSAALAYCQDKGATLAHKNVRTAADRAALLRDHLGLSGTVWLPLLDTNVDGASVVELEWVEDSTGSEFVTSPYEEDSGTTLIGDGDNAVTATTFGSTYSSIQFGDAVGTAFYACEYCPS